MPRTAQELQVGLGEIRRAPRDTGVLSLIVRRPAIEVREVIEEGELDPAVGLVGDNWRQRGSSQTPDRSAHPDMQLTVMSARVLRLIAGDVSRWPLAGDQLIVDFDLSEAALPAGARLAIGDAIVEVTVQPHTGCGKFVERFGLDAMTWVNSPLGRSLRLRGLNARVVYGGRVRVGDTVTRLPAQR
jgi:MOSC domain-containing protein YiiM